MHSGPNHEPSGRILGDASNDVIDLGAQRVAELRRLTIVEVDCLSQFDAGRIMECDQQSLPRPT